jgi:hypothetical protein
VDEGDCGETEKDVYKAGDEKMMAEKGIGYGQGPGISRAMNGRMVWEPGAVRRPLRPLIVKNFVETKRAKQWEADVLPGYHRPEEESQDQHHDENNIPGGAARSQPFHIRFLVLVLAPHLGGRGINSFTQSFTS